ncbi:MAG: hypothetical protein DI561_00355 [Thauera sp.]|nr:MAG: hypothetical protein DI561_00355 [Thauera sp.]
MNDVSYRVMLTCRSLSLNAKRRQQQAVETQQSSVRLVAPMVGGQVIAVSRATIGRMLFALSFHF